MSSTPRTETPPNSDPDPSRSDGRSDGGSEGALPESDLPDEQELERRACELFTLWGVIDRLAHVEVLWNRRLRTTAGSAHLRTIQIHLNPRLLARVPERIDEVLTHEAAHLAVGLVHGHGARHHGPEWVALMAAAGHDGERTHDFPVAGLLRSRSYFLHVCSGCGDRRILEAACAPRSCECKKAKIAVFRAPRTPAGRAALDAHRPDPAPSA